MTRFLKTFWGTVVSVGGVIGLYFAAEAAKVVWTFWVVRDRGAPGRHQQAALWTVFGV
jgi:hypothetical protein